MNGCVCLTGWKSCLKFSTCLGFDLTEWRRTRKPKLMGTNMRTKHFPKAMVGAVANCLPVSQAQTPILGPRAKDSFD